MDPVVIQVVIGYVMTFVIEFFKKAAWFPWLTDQSDRMVKIATGWIVAAASACAVTFSYDAAGNLFVTGLTWANVKGGLTAFIVSLAAQKVFYRTIKPGVAP